MNLDLFDTRTYYFNKRLLWTSGIWPFQEHTYPRRVFFLFSLISVLIPQILNIVIQWNQSMDQVIETVPGAITNINSVIKYSNFIMNIEKMKQLLVHIRKDYGDMLRLPQRTLMERGAMIGREYTIYYNSALIVFTSIYILMPMLPAVLNIVYPLNETRELKLIFVSYYSVDPQEYYVPIMLHELLATFATIQLICAIDSMYIVYTQHASTSFTIVSNHIKFLHIMEDSFIDDEVENCLNEKYDGKIYTQVEYDKMYEKMKFGIELHNNALTYSEMLRSTLSTVLAFEVAIHVIAISLTGYQLVVYMGDSNEMMKYGSFFSGQLIHLFFISIPGQRMLDYSIDVFHNSCAARWYLFPQKVKNLYRLLLRRSLVPCCITAGKFTVMGMETFLSITQTSMSYFTVLSSVR